jgi:adenosylmethionine-8-amino-7-oxononanoate aminotransferase
MMAAVELTAEIRDRRPAATSVLMKGAREAGVIVRPGGTAVAVSPPLTASPEHFKLIAQAIEYGLNSLREDALLAA